MIRRLVALAGVLGCGGEGGGRDGAVLPADAAPMADVAPDTATDLRPDVIAREDLAPSSGLFVDRKEVDFGVFHLGCPRAAATVSVVNWTAGVAGPLLATIDAPFRLGADGCSTGLLAPGDSCALEVQVDPEAPGALAGVLQIWSSASDLVKVRLKVSVADLVPSFLLSPEALDFGGVPTGQSATRSVTVSVPAGFRTVPRVAAAVIGAEFMVSRDGCQGSLVAGQGCHVEVAFHPTAAGPRAGALTLSAPAPCPPFQSQVLLKGTGQ